jgi:hypothetical protein
MSLNQRADCFSTRIQIALQEFVSDGEQIVKVLRREESEDILLVFNAEICPHPHVANHGAGKRGGQLLRKAVTPAAVRIEFTLTHV